MVRQPGSEPGAKLAKRKRVALYAEITPEARRQLRILAEQDTRIEALVAEALNLLFEKHGKLPVESMQFRGGDHAAAAVAL
jgi:hypothetical protein